jgi:ubiquinone biosynthesis protein
VYAELSSSDMLVMERVHGTPLGNMSLGQIPVDDRRQIADSILNTLLHQLLVVGTFHADPHPGNIMVMENGRAILLDFGSVGRIDKVTRQALLRMLIAWDFGDPLAATDALLVMADHPADLRERQLERDMGAFIGTWVVPGASIGSQAVADLFGIVARNGLTMPPELAAALRAIGTMEGTLTWLVPGYNIVAEARAFAEHHMKELLRPRSLQAMFAEEAVALMPLLQRLPRRIDRITAAMEEGRFNVNVAAFAHQRERDVVRGLMQEMLLTFLAAASGVMATMLISKDAGPLLVPGMTVLQFMGYFLAVLALILAMRVLIFIFRRPV